ncbi:hypothetical protein SRABI106_03400 [Rahnella aquatilis]|nr:hypothetical protein SRABI106_03400 [Rahnella aquatilis]
MNWNWKTINRFPLRKITFPSKEYANGRLKAARYRQNIKTEKLTQSGFLLQAGHHARFILLVLLQTISA